MMSIKLELDTISSSAFDEFLDFCLEPTYICCSFLFLSFEGLPIIVIDISLFLNFYLLKILSSLFSLRRMGCNHANSVLFYIIQNHFIQNCCPFVADILHNIIASLLVAN